MKKAVYGIVSGLFLVALLIPNAFAQQQEKQVTVPVAIQKQLDQVENRLDVAIEHYEGATQDLLTNQKPLPLSVHLVLVLAGGLLGLLLLRIFKKRLDQLLTKADAIRESDARLRAKTVSQLFYWLGIVCIVGSMIYMSLGALGVNLAPVVAGVGVLGLALGFGAQSLVKDVINGIFILLEDQYHVNDVISVGDLSGLVEQVNLRVTVLRNLEGQVIYIPNGEIKTVKNMTKGWSRAVLDIGVAYKENVDRVIQIMKDLGAELRQDAHFGRLMIEDVEVPGLNSFDDSQVTIRCMIKTIPTKQWEVAREFRKRLKSKFDELGIEIPFPHRSLYWGEGQKELFHKIATKSSN